MMTSGIFPDRRRDIGVPIASTVCLVGLMVGAGLLYQVLVGGSAERLVTAMLIDAIMVVGIQVYVGNTGVMSFGHIGFGAIAGYVFALFALGPDRKVNAPYGLDTVEVGPVVATIAAVLVTVAVGVVVGLGLARSGAKSGAVSATVITLALLFVTHEVARNWTEVTGGERAGLSFGIGEKLDSRLPVYCCLFGAVLFAQLYARSRGGRQATAAREDNLAARAMGIDPLVQQMVALLLSVVIVSVAASLRVYEIGTMLPNLFFFNYTLLTLVMLIVGGRNSVTGALVGVAVITIGRELSRRLGSDGFEIFGLGLDGAPLDWIFREGLPTVFLGLAMVGFMIWRPAGLLDDWELGGWLIRRLGDAGPVQFESVDEVRDQTEVRLKATDIEVRFGGFQALNGASLEASSTEVVGIIGPNGAGKTTLVNVLTGLVEPSAGSFTLDGVDVGGESSFQLARLGLVRTFQNLRLFGSLTVRENVETVAFAAAQHRGHQTLPSVDVLVREVGLWEQRDRRARELDYGNSRRLELARAAAMAPTFLLLDEPTSGMSDTESLAMVEQVRHMAAIVGAGVLVIDHDLAFITGIADRIYCLDQGQVIAVGTPDEIQADPHVQAAYLGSATPA